MAFLLLDPKLHPRAAGSILVSEAALATKLGRPAFLVWQILTTRRDADCHTFAKRATISTAKGFEKLPDSVVKDALKRLRSAGLVVDLQAKRRRATLPSGERGWVYGRKVYGARAVSPGRAERLVVVPNTTYHWLNSVSGWGGSRQGSGRAPTPTRIKYPHTEVNQVPPRIYIGPTAQSNPQHGAGEALLRKASPARGAGAPRPGEQPTHTSPGVEVSLMMSKPMTCDPSLGLCLGGNSPRPRLPQPGHMGVPRYPGPTVMPPAIVPRPPKLPENLTDLDVAQWLAKSYRGAVESRYGGRCYVLAKRAELAKSRYLKVLVDGGRTLADYDIAPAAWAAFSVEVWRRHENAKKPPPINWMFGTNRIEERRGWFEAEEGAYNGGRVVHGEAAQDLMHRYVQMQGALTWAQARTEDDVRKVVERFFPNGLYDRLLALAREQSQDDQRRMNDAVARGEWVGW